MAGDTYRLFSVHGVGRSYAAGIAVRSAAFASCAVAVSALAITNGNCRRSKLPSWRSADSISFLTDTMIMVVSLTDRV